MCLHFSPRSLPEVCRAVSPSRGRPNAEPHAYFAAKAAIHFDRRPRMSFNKSKLAVTASAFVTAALMSSGAQAQQKQLTLCWAAWDPANALVELSKDFTAKTGIAMKYEFVPWPNFAQRMLNELNSKGKLCDLLIGDSQWIGSAATEGHYVKLNEFFDKNGIKMSDFMPATVEGYSTWPKGSKNYYALPAMGDAVAFTYRKDWFARPELRT